MARLVPMPGLALSGVLTLHCTPFTAFHCRAAPAIHQALGRQGTYKTSGNKH
jgi:hypothetical protein